MKNPGNFFLFLVSIILVFATIMEAKKWFQRKSGGFSIQNAQEIKPANPEQGPTTTTSLAEPALPGSNLKPAELATNQDSKKPEDRIAVAITFNVTEDEGADPTQQEWDRMKLALVTELEKSDPLKNWQGRSGKIYELKYVHATSEELKTATTQFRLGLKLKKETNSKWSLKVKLDQLKTSREWQSFLSENQFPLPNPIANIKFAVSEAAIIQQMASILRANIGEKIDLDSKGVKIAVPQPAN